MSQSLWPWPFAESIQSSGPRLNYRCRLRRCSSKRILLRRSQHHTNRNPTLMTLTPLVIYSENKLSQMLLNLFSVLRDVNMNSAYQSSLVQLAHAHTVRQACGKGDQESAWPSETRYLYSTRPFALVNTVITLVAVPCSGWELVLWETSGSVFH